MSVANAKSLLVRANNPLSYTVVTLLELARMERSEELDNFLDIFFDANVRQAITNNASGMRLFGMFLSANIQRIIFHGPKIVFPNKLLLLPPLYQSLNWGFKDNSEWDHAIEAAADHFAKKPNNADAVVLLFLEGMKFGVEHALFLFQKRVEKTDGILYPMNCVRELVDELAQYGWPRLSRFEGKLH